MFRISRFKGYSGQRFGALVRKAAVLERGAYFNANTSP